MKAAVLETIDAPLVIGDVEIGALSHGQVLVKMRVSGICGSQLQEIAGNKGNAKFVPHLLGHEGCGIVEDTGPGVTKVRKGDRVILHWRKGDGLESDFPSYTYKGKAMQSGKVTTFSEYSIVSENRVTPVPDDAPDDLCALLGCGLSTALGVIENDAKVRAGESVMIVGLGGLGACLIAAARLAGARPIICADIHDRKKETAAELGADLFINAKADMREQLPDDLKKRGVDVIIETSGNAKSISGTIPLLAGGGRYVMVGQPKPGESIELVNAVHLFGGEGKTIMATQGGQFSPSRDIPRYLKLHEGGALKIDGLITHRTRLADINEALGLMRSGVANRIMIDIWRQ